MTKWCVVCWPARALRSTSCCIHLGLAGRTTHEHVAYQHTHIYGLAPLTQLTSRFVKHLSWRDRDYLEVKTFEYRMRAFWGCQSREKGGRRRTCERYRINFLNQKVIVNWFFRVEDVSLIDFLIYFSISHSWKRRVQVRKEQESERMRKLLG